MSIRINDQVISGKYEPLSYRYVGEIFQSAIPIDDIRVTLLDGHKIYESEGYGSFIQHMHSIIMLYPQLACTEDEWQAINTEYGECGKFVISENNIRLPKIVSFVQGLSSLQDLATLVEAGLPNITGEHNISGSRGILASSTAISGCFVQGSSSGKGSYGNGSDNPAMNKIGFDASKSNAIYGNSNTVQPQSIRYPYYIVLATGVTQEVKAKEELMTNIPFTLFESKYSEVELNNASWLLSSGQWNSRELYPSAYNELVRAYSEGSSKLSVKLHISEYSDYDFVLNLNDETFRLPLLDGSESLVSDRYENWELLESGATYTAPANGWIQLSKSCTANDQFVLLGEFSRMSTIGWSGYKDNAAQANIYVTKGQTIPIYYSAVGTATTFKFYYAKGNGSLYFYVGETVQNTSLINTGKLTQEVAELKNKVHLKESYTNGTSWYRVYSDGWCEQGGSITSGSGWRTISFIKQFKDLPNITTSCSDNGSKDSCATSLSINSITTSNFQCALCWASNSQWGYITATEDRRASWQACGYIT